MTNKRRDFIKLAGMTGFGIANPGWLNGFAGTGSPQPNVPGNPAHLVNATGEANSVIGAYGQWAAGFQENKLPSLSFRRKEFSDLPGWKKAARKRLTERLSTPLIKGMPEITVKRKFTFDGLDFEELSWQLPYGPPTDALVLKPTNAKGKLPGILAFHDHGGLK